MEKSDLELIQKYAKDGNELEMLYKKHLALDEDVAKIQALDCMAPEQIQELKLLKKRKLEGRDQMEEILKNLRDDDSVG